jgi:O-methyltransferase
VSLRDEIKRRVPEEWIERRRERNLRHFEHPLPIVLPHSLVDPLNLLFIKRVAERLDRAGVAGDFVEAGVYRGGSAGVLAAQAMKSPDRRLWLFDAFAGMPAAGEHDDERSHAIEGQYVGSEARTRQILSRVGMDPRRTELRVGWFDDTFPHADVERIALLHVDCDFYDPVKLTLETFYERVAPGGYVIINDYGSYEGARVAVDEWLAETGHGITPVGLDMHVAFFAKPEPGGRWPDGPPIPDFRTASPTR